MNFLSRTFSSLTAGGIPYHIGDKLQAGLSEDPHAPSIWNVYIGTKKEDYSPCTVFEFHKGSPVNGPFIPLAQNAAKKIKSVKLPGVLQVFDTFESDTHIYIISERVAPLSLNGLSLETKLWGSYLLANAVKYINVEAKSVHGNINLSSIFVNESCEWKLGGFEMLHAIGTEPPFSSSPLFPIEKGGIKHDSYMLGSILGQIFQQDGPKSMIPLLQKMVSKSVTIRPSAQQFLEKGNQSFFQTRLIKCYNEIAEINLRTDAEKVDFFNSLEGIEEECPDGFIKNKILPELIRLFHCSSEENSIILYSILKFGGMVSKNVFENVVKPVIFKAYTFPDRSARMALLSALPSYIDNLSNGEVSDKIFPLIVTGFTDTNTTIKEETIKSLLVLAPKLSDRQLNNELLRFLAKTQNDPVPEIRTNTVICLGKIAPHLNKSSRCGVLVTAFTKSMKDPFIPSRLSAVMAFGTSIDLFEPEVCCSRVLSAIAPCLLDRSSKVRHEADKVFQSYMAKIRTASESLPEDDESVQQNEMHQQKELNKTMLGVSFGWSTLSNLSDRMAGEMKVEEGPHQRQQKAEVSEPNNASKEPVVSEQVPETSDWGDDGWGFEDLSPKLEENDNWGEDW